MNAPLRIASVCRSLPTPQDPSSGIFVFNRLAAMNRQAAVQAFQPVPYLPAVKPLPQWARAPGRELQGLPVAHAPMLYVPGVLKSLDAFWLQRSISAQIRQQPFDLIDAHFGYPEGAGCVRLAQRLGIPAFVTIRGFENEYVHKPGIAGQMLAAMRAAAGCISVSHSLRELAIEHGVDPERVRVVHNAIDATRFRRGDRAQARALAGVAADVPLVVSVGHLISRKRHHVLLQAFARVRRAHPRAQLVIIGARSFERQYPAQLQGLAQQLGIADAVRFAGNLPPHEVIGWLQAANVFALGTAREGCCNAVLEALAVGVPVVTTATGDNAFFVHSGRNGFIVDVDDAEGLARSLADTLAKADWDYDAISRQLHAEVGSWDDVATRVLNFMRERVGRGIPRSASAVRVGAVSL